MSTVSTFGTFTMARLGIYVSQKALDITGNNISNINNTKYTRQVLDQSSLYTGGSDRYASKYDIRIGNGAIATGTSQLRDQYLDIRYRTEQASVGALTAKANGLNNIGAVLDEVADGTDDEGVLEGQFNDLIDQMEELVTNGAGKDKYDTLVRSSATSLVGIFNDYANRLETIYKNQDGALKQDIDTVNSILSSIRDLNASIRKSQIHGADALEQKDERNYLIDQLSQYMRIDVTYEQEHIAEDFYIDKLVIRLNGNDLEHRDANNATLVDGIYATQLFLRTEPQKNADGKYVGEDGKTEDADGKPITEENAARVPTGNYDIDLSALADSLGRIQVLDAKTEMLTDNDYATEEAANTALEDETAFPKEGKGESYEYRVVKIADGKYQIEKTTKSLSERVELFDNTLYGALQAERELLTEQGEYATEEQLAADPDSATKRGIRYYQKALDTLANQFAGMMNQANVPEPYSVEDLAGLVNAPDFKWEDLKIPSDAVFQDENGGLFKLGTEEVLVDGKNVTRFKTIGPTCSLQGSQLDVGPYLTVEQMKHLLPANADGLDHGVHEDVTAEEYAKDNLAKHTLFSNNGNGDDPEGITAANISISKSWAEGSTRILQSTKPNYTSTDNSNLAHILVMLQGAHEFTPDANDLDTGAQEKDGVFFTGTFQEFLTNNVASTLANDQMTTNAMLTNHSASADELYVDRDAVGGVDLNDEAMNLMQYQKSYSAACRLMTTVDEMLDKLINGTGRAGL